MRNEKEACAPYDPHGLSPFSFNPARSLYLLRTSAIQASLIALGLASVLLSSLIMLLRNEKEACTPYDPHGLSSFSFFLSSLIMLLRNEKEACAPYVPHGLSPFSFLLSPLITLLRNEKEARKPYDPHGLSPFSFFLSPLIMYFSLRHSVNASSSVSG